jgi:HlyD family secretion protein
MRSSDQGRLIHNHATVGCGTVSGVAPSLVSPPAALPSPLRQRAYHRLILLLVVLTAILGLWTWQAQRARQAVAPGGQAIATAIVELRPFIAKLRLSGTVEAVESTSILSPRLAGGTGGSQMVITRLAANGTQVKKGDFLVEFDRQTQLSEALDKQAEYRNLEDQFQKKVAEQEASQAHDETELIKAENDLAKARLEMQRNEIISRIDAERNRLTLEEAEVQLKQLRQTFALKRRAAEADRKNLEIQRDRARDAMEFARRDAERMSVHTPIDGLVVLNSIWKSGSMGEVQEGDQVWSGMAFMQVVDTSAMQVRARVNQVDIPHLSAGQPAEVRLDAYPDAVFSGKVDQIAAIGVPSDFGENVRVFSVIFSIQGSDSRLMPDLTTAIDVELDRQPNALVAPRDAIVSDGEKSWAWVKGGLGFEKRPVKVAELSDMEAVIESGLQAGDVVKRNLFSGGGAL